MIRRSLAICLLAAFVVMVTISLAEASSTFTNLPAANQPIGNSGTSGPTYVPLDQGQGCVHNTSPCQTVQSDALRLGQPIQANCTSILSPWQYQQCIDTSVNPTILKEYIGTTWWSLLTLNPSTGPIVDIPLTITVGSTSISGGTSNGLLYNNGGFVGNLGTSPNDILVTNGSSIPGLSNTLPSQVQGNITQTGTVTQGVWASSIQGAIINNGGANFVATNGYQGNTGSANIIGVLGSIGVPNTGYNGQNLFEVIGGTNAVATVTSSIYGLAIKPPGQNGNSYHVAGAFFEAQDDSGWSGMVGGANNNFVEGSRSQGFLSNSAVLGTATGSVSVAYEAAGVQYLYLIGHESEVDNLYSDASSTFNANQFATAYLATSGNGSTVFRSDAAYMINPFNTTPFYRGFFVPRGTSAGRSVSFSQFEGDDESTWGLNLENAILTNAIGIPNNSPIRGVNHTSNADFNLLFVGSDDSLRFGSDTGLSGIIIASSSVTTTIGGPVDAVTTVAVGSGFTNALNLSGSNTSVNGGPSIATSGGDLVLAPQTGKVRLPNNAALEFENAASNAEYSVVSVFNDNTLRIGFGLPSASVVWLGNTAETADVAIGNNVSLATGATSGFFSFGTMNGAATGVPVNNTTSTAQCVINYASAALNCYINGSWNHLTFSPGAG